MVGEPAGISPPSRPVFDLGRSLWLCPVSAQITCYVVINGPYGRPNSSMLVVAGFAVGPGVVVVFVGGVGDEFDVGDGCAADARAGLSSGHFHFTDGLRSTTFTPPCLVEYTN